MPRLFAACVCMALAAGFCACGSFELAPASEQVPSANPSAAAADANVLLRPSGSPASDGNVAQKPAAADTADADVPPNDGTFLSSDLPQGVFRVPMAGCAKANYFAQMTVGNNTSSLLLDSGSGMMAVATSSCTSCGAADAYDTSHGVRKPTTTSSTYADGSSWQGTVYNDKVAMGPVNARLTAQVPVDFVAITAADSFFYQGSCTKQNDVAFDGILGLGTDALLRRGTSSFLTALTATKTLAADTFALRTCNVGGTLWLGGYDANALSAAPSYTDRATSSAELSSHYTMNVNGLSLGGADLGVSAAAIGPMVVDNGTTGLLLSEAAFDALKTQLYQNTAFLANFRSGFLTGARCSQSRQGLTLAQLDAALPKLTFTLPKSGGGSFTLELTASNAYLVALRLDDGSIYYCPQVFPQLDDKTPAIFGNAAMRQHVVIFDRAGKRIGFAPHTTCPSTLGLLPISG